MERVLTKLQGKNKISSSRSNRQRDQTANTKESYEF
jgi:hypothetical protein